MIRRIRNDIQVGLRLIENGVTLGSVLLYPVRCRRSRNPEKRLKLRNGVTISSPVSDELLYLFEEIWVEGSYSKRFEILPGATVIDIGANAGVFALWAAKREAARVIAVEPSPQTFKHLSCNVALNHLKNITPVQAACGGKRGEAVLYSRGDETLNSLYCRDVLGSTFRPLCRTQVITLDDIFSRYGVETCDFLKIDCEGAEYDILLNASENTLRRIRTLTAEYHVGMNEHDPMELVNFLEARGFIAEKTPISPSQEDVGYLYATHRP